ncbi:hypothetical protein C1H76_1009 [Elsinoe australis]|uniref:Glyoxalase-like domain-containing protein n=1 Tax=Elsinoe australis TaxID=40998 RepID=A0A4U7BE36_9PEZI|nr:hypothetical protein C1H76_1009 [Elsinoe australis]
MTPKIDHIIVGLPYNDLLDLPTWLTENFTISPGGRHADNKTENKLIIFKDGSYIELIAFINDDPEKKKGHWWGDHGSGYIDWAFTSDSSDDVFAVNERLEKAGSVLNGARYKPPQEGGRTKPDGTEIKWTVTFPEKVRRGEVPFWCHDVTPRELRVPKDEASTAHPCGALGVGSLTMLVPGKNMVSFNKFYTAVNDQEGVEDDTVVRWDIDASIDGPGLRRPQVVLSKMRLDNGDFMGDYAVISHIALLTDTKGSGKSRESLTEQLGDKAMRIEFVHGRQG